jgi:hypothetical protein
MSRFKSILDDIQFHDCSENIPQPVSKCFHYISCIPYYLFYINRMEHLPSSSTVVMEEVSMYFGDRIVKLKTFDASGGGLELNGGIVRRVKNKSRQTYLHENFS